MARPTGFEPAISSVTGRRDGPTSLRAQAPNSISRIIQGCNRGIAFIFLAIIGIIDLMCRYSSVGRAALS